MPVGGQVDRHAQEPLAIERLAQGIHDTTEESLTHRNREQSTGRFRLVSFGDFRGITEQDCADFGFFEIQGQAVDASGEFDHLV